MKILLWILPAVLLSGCAGSRCRVTARSIQQPVSCTPCVLDSAGRIRKAQPNEVVKHFVLTKSNWSMLWKAIPLSHREWDVSQEIEAKLRESSGNAVVNLTLRATGSDFLDWYFAALVPILPSYVSVKLEGDIVRIPDTP